MGGKWGPWKGIARGIGVAALAAFIGGIGGACRSGTGDFLRETREVYAGIPAEITFAVPEGHGEEARRWMAACWEEVERVGRVVNAFSADSEVGRLNAVRKTEPWPLSGELAGLLLRCRQVFEATSGAFDPTVWPLKQVFRQARAEGRLPDPQRLAEARDRVGMGRVHLDGDRVRFEVPEAALDLGGIAKGHAVDRVVEFLEGQGVTRYLVRIGGEIGASGTSPQGRPWRIGVQHPRIPGQPIGVLEVPGRVFVSTSGPYEQPVVIEGQVFHHVFDPRTGEPAPLDVLGVTVVSRAGPREGARVDALATGLAVLGPTEGLAVASREGVDALFLVAGPGDSITTRATPGMEVIYRPLGDTR